MNTLKSMLSYPFFRILVPVARKARFIRLGSLYHLAAFHLQHKLVRGIIDGGAYDGTDSLYLAKLFPEATILAFEPAPESFKRLTKAVAREKKIKPMRFALAEEEGTAMININSFAATNSLLTTRSDSDAQAMFDGRGRTLTTAEIETTTIDKAVRQLPDFECAVLKLDLQGYEIPALRGACDTLRKSIVAVISEVRFKPLYVGDVLFPDVDAFLARHGFRLMDLQEITPHPTDNTAFEANGLWLKM